eukprot:GHVQ01019279.1.p1 GENE.GHVQ01019279.1~~GHVQ01019279.1.p1  ORF type:complete len:103 (+),score=8.97 GHVQ01019279.1:391-699(+)
MYALALDRSSHKDHNNNTNEYPHRGYLCMTTTHIDRHHHAHRGYFCMTTTHIDRHHHAHRGYLCMTTTRIDRHHHAPRFLECRLGELFSPVGDYSETTLRLL